MKRNTFILGAAAVFALPMGHAQAQTDKDGIADIVVTATRTGATNVQDTPIAVTAFGAEQIKNMNITVPQDIQFHVPNVTLVTESQGSVTFGIRGINVAVDNFSFDSAVGIYVNDVYVARSSDTASLLFDTASLEVLRGPQGTTFGRNTPTGAIVVNTTRPGHDLGGYLEVSGFNHDHGRAGARIEGAIDLPFNADIGLRVAGYYVNDGGWGKNRFNGYKYNSKDDYLIRATLDGEIAPGLQATLIGEFSRQVHGQLLFVSRGQNAPLLTAYDKTIPGPATPNADLMNQLTAADAKYYNFSELNQKGKGKGESLTLQLKWDLTDDINLRSITGYRHIDQRTNLDQEGTQLSSSVAFNHIQQRQYSQEFLLNADLMDRLHFLGGVFLFKETGSDENLLPNIPVSFDPAQTKGTFFYSPLLLRGEGIKNKALGIYGNATFDITDTLSIAGGVRYSKENKFVNLNSRFTTLPQVLIGFGFPPATANAFSTLAVGPASFKDDVVVYDGRLNWKPNDDTLVYLKYGTGYRAGGIGFRAAATFFNPETSKTWEAGGKFDFDAGNVPLRLNLAAFHTIYNGFQVPVVLLNPVRQTVVNAGKARIQGIEAELTAKPAENFDLGMSVGLLDAKYKNFFLNNASISAAPINFTGNKLRRAPKFQLNANATYRVPMGNESQLLFQLDFAYQGAQEQDPFVQPGAPVTDTAGNVIFPALRKSTYHLKGFGIVNGMIKLQNAMGSGVDLSIWGKNLTDKAYIAYSLHVSESESAVYSEPRSYGVTLRKSF